jgi:hypothetical protein
MKYEGEWQACGKRYTNTTNINSFSNNHLIKISI